MKLVLVRHGETAWNREGRFQGRMDIPLNETGREQGQAVAGVLGDYPLDALCTSPLARAAETAGFTAAAQGVEPLVMEAFSEIDHGEWEGLSAGEVERRWPGMLTTWHSTPEAVVMPGGESLSMVQRRVERGMQNLLDLGGSAVALFTHDAVLKVMLCSMLGLPLGAFWSFQMANAGISLLERRDARWRVQLLGDVCHYGPFYRRVDQAGL
ncbi:MAG: histidine phosphatase family protein [Synergistales bacterium]|nr:histidine phosphatase family protein [Synergistales bacterium]